MRPELLEDVLMSVCLKHCGMGSTLLLLGKEDPESIEQSRAFLDAVFTHINGLERRLQVNTYVCRWGGGFASAGE